MFSQPPAVSVTKDDNMTPPIEQSGNLGPLNPPIITHTGPTPAATPQGSPNEKSNNNNDTKNSLSVNAFNMGSLSIDSIDESSVSYKMLKTIKCYYEL